MLGKAFTRELVLYFSKETSCFLTYGEDLRINISSGSKCNRTLGGDNRGSSRGCAVEFHLKKGEQYCPNIRRGLGF